jgi:hypothetical protein
MPNAIAFTFLVLKKMLDFDPITAELDHKG